MFCSSMIWLEINRPERSSAQVGGLCISASCYDIHKRCAWRLGICLRPSLKISGLSRVQLWYECSVY